MRYDSTRKKGCFIYLEFWRLKMPRTAESTRSEAYAKVPRVMNSITNY